EWNKPMPETEALMKIMDRIKPDLMYPLHNHGFGGAHFFSNVKLDDEYYERIFAGTKELGIPLHMGEPEEKFIKEIKKPFYWIFGFKEYYDLEKKLGVDPTKVLIHGDDSSVYLKRIVP